MPKSAKATSLFFLHGLATHLSACSHVLHAACLNGAFALRCVALSGVCVTWLVAHACVYHGLSGWNVRLLCGLYECLSTQPIQMLACMTHLLARLCGPYAWCAPHSLRMTHLLGATTWLPCSLSECCVHLSTLPPFCTYFLSPCLNCDCHNIFHVS